ncbi:MAG: Asp-tRNA(Asn)/Glu-tRNA(Gln) amidotransferase subunit GatC [Myxococcales bacterium]|nr:Asp-tRNA(Asn)/Glu-tRNA(Gln) amidotransferase subunit GatC [Myxococcales bacterium]
MEYLSIDSVLHGPFQAPSQASTADRVAHVARLARIELRPEEAAMLGHDLDRILAYVEELRAVDTDAVEPMIHAGDRGLVLRQDVERDGLGAAMATAGAPATEGGAFVVPRVIG